MSPNKDYINLYAHIEREKNSYLQTIIRSEQSLYYVTIHLFINTLQTLYMTNFVYFIRTV